MGQSELIKVKNQLWNKAKKNVKARIRSEQMAPFLIPIFFGLITSFFLWMFADRFFMFVFFLCATCIIFRNHILPIGKIDENEIFEETLKIIEDRKKEYSPEVDEIAKDFLELRQDFSKNKNKLKEQLRDTKDNFKLLGKLETALKD